MIFKILFTSFIFSVSVQASEVIEIKDLGQLDLKFSTVNQVKSLALRPIKATVSHKTGEAFQLVAPFEPQRHEFLVKNGDFVQANKPVMILSGSEVHHFLEQYEAAKSLFNLTKSRYDLNKKLFKQKSISNDKWLSISQNYFENKIEYGHYRHFMELVDSFKTDDEMIIKAPFDGYFFYPDTESISAGELKLGQVLPKESLRIEAYTGIDEANKLEYFETEHCQINIAEVSQLAEGFFLKVWSLPIPDDCQLSMGENTKVIPHLATSAYQVPKSSVFAIDRDSFIMIKQGQSLISTPVNILDSNGSVYYLDSEVDLHNKEVLSTSAAAVQGILMGLGGE